MKNVSLGLNVLLIGFILFQSFMQKPAAAPAATNQIRCNTICMDYSSSNLPYRMNSNVLKMMSANYRYGQTPAGSSQNPGTDATSAWFSLNTLKRFLWQIESEVCKKSGTCRLSDSLGVRFYYARYPDNTPVPGTNGTPLWTQYTDLRSVPNQYRKQHTFFMVPTFDMNGAHWDFDPFTVSFTKKCIPSQTLFTQLTPFRMTREHIVIPSMAGSVSISALAPDPDPAAKNHSELCPPYPSGSSTCPGAYFGGN